MSSPHPSSSAQSKKKKPRPAAQPPILPPVDEDKMARLKTRLGERAIAYLQEVNLVLDDQAQQMLGDWAMSLMLGVVAAADESATKQDRNHITSGDITAGIQQACQAGDSRPTMVDYATTTNMVNKKQLPKPRKGLQGMPNDVVAKNKEIIVNAAKKEQLQKMTEERRHALECEPSTSTVSDGWPLYGLRPKSGINMTALYEVLAKEAANSPNWDVFLRDVDMPERWHFSKNPRIAPLWIVPKTGWAIVTRPEHDPSKTNKPYNPRGLHGYDNMHPLMRSIFIARGPAFPHPPGSKVEPFGNWEVYSIICHSLGLQQSPIGNNGTLSWGTPNGGFKFTSSKEEEDVHDFPAEASVTTAAPSVPSESFKPTTSLDDNEKAILSHISEAKSIQADEPVTETMVPTTHPRPTVDTPASASGVVPTDAPKVDRPAVVDDSTGNKTEAEKQAEAEKHGFKNWLEYMKDKAKAITQKISDWWKNFWGA